MISIKSISKEFGNETGAVSVLKDIDLDIAEGQFVTIFGPNGSGKSTLLNLLAGLETVTNGEIKIQGKSPKDSKIGFVFQNYNESLFPWKTVIENIYFPLEMAKVAKDEYIKVAEHLLKKVGLYSLKDKFVYELSGGQKQLVSICRSIAYNPDVLIMDEPFSALDYSTTRKMELELLDLWQEKKITTVFVSHDVDEAIFLADKVVVLSPCPGSIKETFAINLPRPRTLDMLMTPQFIEIRNAILKTFEYEK